MPDDWALERAREILREIVRIASEAIRGKMRPGFLAEMRNAQAEAIAAELRKERERAEAAEARAAAMEKQVNDLLGNEVRTAEAEIRAAALEAALQKSACRCMKRFKLICPICSTPLTDGQDQFAGSWICPACIKVVPERDLALDTFAECWRCSALRDHGGALAAHDADVRRKALTEAEAIVQEWERAYPEEAFPPLPPANTESMEMKMYRTRASAQMGRHMSRRLIEQLRELAEKEQG
jgi:hypothetical protein